MNWNTSFPYTNPQHPIPISQLFQKNSTIDFRVFFRESRSIFQFLLFFFFFNTANHQYFPPNFSANRIYTKLEKKPSNILRLHLLMRVYVCVVSVCVWVFYLRESFVTFVFESSYGNYEILFVFLFLQNCAIFFTILLITNCLGCCFRIRYNLFKCYLIYNIYICCCLY